MLGSNITNITLGSKVRDPITGFEGIVTARTEWLYGCVRVSVQAPELKDGKPIEEQWFDETRVEMIGATAGSKSDPEEPTGGSRRDPSLPRGY
jgi:hypothetical protein